VKLSGDTIDGGTWAMPTSQDTVVVVNVWGSWCPPCVAETPTLQKVWSDFETKAAGGGGKVAFIGIDFREDPARGQAFAKKSGVTYPSLSDESGVQILGLQGKAPSVPTTLVLDTKGRIAARVNGAVTEITLTGLIDDVLAESGPS
jgi:thiol-disulfide isomerase/thioredoxin